MVAPNMHTRVGATWKVVDALHTRVGATWKAVNVGHVNVGGVWKEFFSAATVVVTLTNRTMTASDTGAGANDCTAGVRCNADGTLDQNEDDVYTQRNALTDWIIPNSESSTTYYIRATEISYDVTVDTPAVFGTRTGTMGSWDTLGNGSTREWDLRTQSNTAGIGHIIWVIDLEIASDSGGTDILDIGRFTLRGDVGAGGP